MRLKEIVLAVSLASCATLPAPKTTRTPGPDGIIGNLPETECPNGYTRHVEEVISRVTGDRATIRACLVNSIPSIKAHCETHFSGDFSAWKENGVYVWGCDYMAVQSVNSGLVATEVNSGLVAAEVPSGLVVQEVKSGLSSASVPTGLVGQEVKPAPATDPSKSTDNPSAPKR